MPLFSLTTVLIFSGPKPMMDEPLISEYEKVHSTIEALVKCTCTDIYTEGIPETLFLYSGALKTYKSLEISRYFLSHNTVSYILHV